MVLNDLSLSGKVALVTGGGTGIGGGITKGLAEAGASIACVYSRHEPTEMQAYVESIGGSFLAIKADVGDMERLRPVDQGVIVLGGSSDHCILDIENCPRKLKPGDIMEFSLSYNNMLYATNRRDIPIKFLHE